MSDASIKSTLEKHAPALMSIPGVVATAEGQCGGVPCIKVYVRKRTDAVVRRVPSSIAGHPVSIVESGPVRAR